MKKEILVLVMILSCITLANSVEANSYDNAYLEITLLNQDPDPGEQGEYLDLRWKVIKKGNDKMDNLQFHLNLDFPFFFDKIDSADKTVGSWTGYSDDEEYYILHYKVRVDDEALEDTYKLKLKIKHDDSGISMMREYEITVGDKTDPELVLGTLVTSPVELLADTNENQLQVTLENIGDENAETVKMDLELPEGFTPTYGYSNKANLGTVNADESGTATFYVDIDEDITAGEHEGKIIVQYKEADDDDNVYKTVKLPLSIPINGKPMFTIDNIKTIPEKVKAGTPVQIILTVKNTGTKTAESVSIRAFKESSQPFEFEEKSDFIGKLKPGESGEGVLKFDVEDGANVKTYLLDLEIRSIYNNEVITESEVVPIKVQNGEKKGLFSGGNAIVGFLIIAAIVMIVIIGLTTYHLIRKKKK